MSYAQTQTEPVKLNFIPIDVLLDASINDFDHNQFVQNLLHSVEFPFNFQDVFGIIKMYRLGTMPDYGELAGACVFPFIDENHKIRAMQAKTFHHPTNIEQSSEYVSTLIERDCKKSGDKLPEWLQEYKKNTSKVSCLFGAHLLKEYPGNPVAIVSDPKSAIYGSLYFGLPEGPDDLVWMATGTNTMTKDTVTINKCKALTGRRVTLYPDLSPDGSTYQIWSDKAAELNAKIPGIKVIVSDLLESSATDHEKDLSYTLADMISSSDWREFRSQSAQPQRVACFNGYYDHPWRSGLV